MTYLPAHPRCPIRLTASGAHLAVDADEPGADSVARQHAYEFVDTETLGDAAQIPCERPMLAGPALRHVDLQQFVYRWIPPCPFG